MHSYRAFWLFFLSACWILPNLRRRRTASMPSKHNHTRLVENVDIIGNRRLRKDDILYYIKPGQATRTTKIRYSAITKRCLTLNFFDKTATACSPKTVPRRRQRHFRSQRTADYSRLDV